MGSPSIWACPISIRLARWGGRRRRFGGVAIAGADTQYGPGGARRTFVLEKGGVRNAGVCGSSINANLRNHQISALWVQMCENWTVRYVITK